MSIADSPCSNIYIANIFPIYPFIAGVIELSLMLLLIFIFKYRSYVSSWYSGESGVKEGVTMILPLYFNVFYFAIIVGIIVGINAIVGVKLSVYVEVIRWIVIRSCCDGLAIFLIHNGIGQRALSNAITIGLSWAILSGSIPLLVYYFANNYRYNSYLISVITFTSLLLLLYFCYGTVSMNLLHRRPALIRYSHANFVLISLSLIENILLLNNYSNTSCIIEALGLVSDCILPFIILIAIRRDSMFWQGLYRINESNGLNQPLMGVWEMGRDTIKYVADTINQLERLVVPIIPFTQLKVDTSKFFSGGTARVYRGKFGMKEVAIKFLFSIELTPDAVISFCDEATILNSLQHPNIVKCYGVAVMPPALCLVTEFCDYGSLYDFLHSTDIIVRESTSSANVQIRPHLSSNDSSRLSTITKSSMNEQIRNSTSNYELRYSNLADTSRLSLSYNDNMIENKNPLLDERLRNSSSASNNESLSDNAPSKLAEATLLQNNSYSISILSRSNLSINNEITIDNNNNSVIIPDSSTVSSGSSLFSGSTLEKKDFSIRIADSTGQISHEETLSNPSKIKSFQQNLFSSFSHKKTNNNKLKAAEKIMRSINYGLGPQKPNHKSKRNIADISSNNIGDLLLASTNNSQSISQTDKPRASLLDLSLSSSHHSETAGRSLPFPLRIRMARDAAAGVAYMHSKKLMHCDIKSLNFLVTKDLKVKLADVGEARSVDLTDSDIGILPKNVNWSSPEVLKGTSGINLSADIWSLAVVLSEIFTGNIPFDTPAIRLMPYEEFCKQLEAGLRPELSSSLLKEHPYLKDTIADAWKYNPDNRITALDLVVRLESYYTSKYGRSLMSTHSNLSNSSV